MSKADALLAALSNLNQHDQPEPVTSAAPRPVAAPPDDLPPFLARVVAEPVGADRSAQSYALVAALWEQGYGRPRILDIVRSHAPTVDKYGTDSRLEREVTRMVDKAEREGPCGWKRQRWLLERERQRQDVADTLTSTHKKGDTEARERPVLRYTPGGDWIANAPDRIPALWGNEDTSEVLWSQGEPLLIVGPPGVGKSTLGQQVVLGRLGLVDQVLGYPIKPAAGKVLYLALDRPEQIRRSLRRMFQDEWVDTFNDRLIPWTRSIGDLGKKPELLVELALQLEVSDIVIDSLKDVCSKLTDDESGSNLNRAMQDCIAEGIEVTAYHHQRKSQEGSKPKLLDDVYGSRWITAGAGSVLMLWGQAGDAIVELSQLKEPGDKVGPVQIEHDHHAGRTTLYRGLVDPLVFVENRPNGVTALELAKVMFDKTSPTDAERLRAQRKLDALAGAGRIEKRPATRGGTGGTQPALYLPVATVFGLHQEAS